MLLLQWSLFKCKILTIFLCHEFIIRSSGSLVEEKDGHSLFVYMCSATPRGAAENDHVSSIKIQDPGTVPSTSTNVGSVFCLHGFIVET